MGVPPQDEAKKDSDLNALLHNLDITVGYLRLRMIMENVLLNLNTRIEITSCSG